MMFRCVLGGARTRTPLTPLADLSQGCSALTFDDFATSSANYSCYPYDWPTVPEYLQELGVSWQFFQGERRVDRANTLLTGPNVERSFSGRQLWRQPSAIFRELSKRLDRRQLQ